MPATAKRFRTFDCMTTTNDTIAAIATPPGMGAIAVLRISGSDAFVVLKKIFRTKKNTSIDIDNLQSHTMHFGTIVHNEVIIDEVLISIFKNPHSYTGDDTVEISCHGAVFIQQKILQIIISNGARMAAPGEFTMRAFMNKKLDLSQAEAVGELIASDSAARHRTALNQLRGGIKNEIQELRNELIHAASLLELELDFSEEDVEFVSRTDLKKLIQRIETKIVSLINSFETGNALRNGIPVVIAGSPNVGKSTLLNALLKEDRAIVSEIAGTTRDALHELIEIDGVAVHVTDTAGLRETDDPVERIGVDRAWAEIARADIVIQLVDARDGVGAGDAAIAARLPVGARRLVVENKIDLAGFAVGREDCDGVVHLRLCAKSGEGVDLLRAELLRIFGWQGGEDVVLARERHLVALERAHETTVVARRRLTQAELCAEELRMAQEALSTITGEFTADDLLGEIFSRFCIGK